MKKIKIDDVIYTPNLDFRVAIKCNNIADDESINQFERPLAIIYLVYGDLGLNHSEHYDKLLNWYMNYLKCGKEIEQQTGTPDMDYEEDKGLIMSSFKYDYKYNPYNEEFLTWEEFYNDLNNLSNSELGNCCVLSRVRYYRNLDLSKIKNEKEREKARKIKNQWALKKYKKKPTKEQKESAKKFFNMLKGVDINE